MCASRSDPEAHITGDRASHKLTYSCTFPSCIGKRTQSRSSNISYLAPAGTTHDIGSRTISQGPRRPLVTGIRLVQKTPSVTECGAMWINVEQDGAMWSNMKKCGAKWSSVEQCRARLSNLEHCGAMWSSLNQCGAVWSSLEQCSCVCFTIRPGSAHNWRPCQP